MLKKKVVKKVPAVKSKTATKSKAVDAMAKARASRAKGTKRVVKMPSYPTWTAPVDFKPHLLEIVVRTDKDGLLGPGIKVTRYRGQITDDPRKKWDVAEYDMQTVLGILSRLSMTTYVTNQAKRLPASTRFRIVIRVSMSKAKGNMLTCSFKEVDRVVKLKSGKVKVVPYDKKDPIYRKFRKSARILPSAFANCLMPPKKTRQRKQAEE